MVGEELTGNDIPPRRTSAVVDSKAVDGGEYCGTISIRIQEELGRRLQK